ncbi:MAG: hypothetical protein QNK37_19610 [Acidobacteriota bacterium]|nr:hypothetical protein [Acidobacteriota bacterium]
MKKLKLKTLTVKSFLTHERKAIKGGMQDLDILGDVTSCGENCTCTPDSEICT